MSRTPIPVTIGTTYEFTITGMSHEGHGVGRHDGFTVFIPGALEEEIVRARIDSIEKRYATAELVDIVQASAQRVDPVCGIYEECGGCQLQHLSYEGQLNFKEKHVRDVLQRIGHLDLDRVTVHPIQGMQDPWRYRNKAQVPVGFGKPLIQNPGHIDTISQAIENSDSMSFHKTDRSSQQLPVFDKEEGGLVVGFYGKGSHDIIDLPSCNIQHQANEDIILKVRDILRELHIPAYERKKDTGIIRHIIAKISFHTKETMIVLVTRSQEIPKQDHLIHMIRERIPHVTSIMHNIQRQTNSRVMGYETLCLWGKPEIYDQIGPIRFAISAESFYQVNPVQTEVLYGKALEYAALTGNETVIDAYCGVGTISLFLAQSARTVYGIEIVKDAIRDAKKNAEINGITNTKFLVGKAEEEIPRLHQKGIHADVVVVDPPRKGCEESLLATIAEMKPKRVVYVSCNPSTLARDLKFLEEHGYRTVEVQPVDMFPHTAHVEAIVRLELKDTVH